MGKGRGRRRAHKHELNIKSAPPLQGNATSPTQQERRTPPQVEGLRSHLSFLDKTFRNWWFYVAAVSLVVNLTYTFRPQLQIQSSTINSNPLDTLFTIANTGPWRLRDIMLTCELYDGNTSITSENNTLKLSHNAPAQGNPNIDELYAGHSATRDCGLGRGLFVLPSLNMRTIRINTIISYRWFLWPTPTRLTQHFNTRQIDTHLILVPDVEPMAEASPSP